MLILPCFHCFSIVKLNPVFLTSNHDYSLRISSSLNHFNDVVIEKAPYTDIIPFVSEHILPSDQLLFLGAYTDMSLSLIKDGYGLQKTGRITVVDTSIDRLEALKSMAVSEDRVSAYIKDGRYQFIAVNCYSEMKSVCKQSTFDSAVDYGALDSLIAGNTEPGKTKFLKAIDHLQNALRLGNVMISLSKTNKETFCPLIDQKFGWVQELDGKFIDSNTSKLNFYLRDT